MDHGGVQVISAPQKNPNGEGFIYQYNYGAGNEFGWAGNRRTSVIEIVVKPDGRIWTAYPK